MNSEKTDRVDAVRAAFDALPDKMMESEVLTTAVFLFLAYNDQRSEGLADFGRAITRIGESPAALATLEAQRITVN